MAAMGHEDAFLRPRLNARYYFSKGTLAGTRGNGRDAFAVGTSVTGRPPHRSGRAGFPHPALTSGV